MRYFNVTGIRGSAYPGRLVTIAIALLFMLGGLQACNKQEKRSYQFYDSHPYSDFIRQLDAAGVQYGKVDNWTITYADGEHQRVMQVVDEIMARYYSDCGGSFQEARRQQALKSRLHKGRVPFRSVQMDDGEKLLCDPRYTEEFNSIYRSVLRSHR
ncbi:MAG: hypothetical protein OEZ10_13260 [Gammaproteobacteria bacterium]|nr:hypothetical protein [Gammaproteobacteria bacterium]